MAGVNKVIIIGNLGRDPELRYTNSGSPVCRLSVATTRKWVNKQTNENQEETEWHRITVWGKQAENANQYLAKGRSVYVEGRLRTSSYTDSETNEKKYSTEIIAEQLQFLGGGRGESEGAEPRGGSSSGRPQNQGGGKSNPKPPQSDFSDDDFGDDDIPF